MPKGLKVIAIVNLLIALLLAWLATSLALPQSSPAIASSLVAWTMGLGVAWGATSLLTLIRRPLAWRLLRAILYGLALLYTLLGIVQFSILGWLINFVMLALLALLVLYIIGARGYLNEPTAQQHFRVEIEEG